MRKKTEDQFEPDYEHEKVIIPEKYFTSMVARVKRANDKWAGQVPEWLMEKTMECAKFWDKQK